MQQNLQYFAQILLILKLQGRGAATPLSRTAMSKTPIFELRAEASSSRFVRPPWQITPHQNCPQQYYPL